MKPKFLFALFICVLSDALLPAAHAAAVANANKKPSNAESVARINTDSAKSVCSVTREIYIPSPKPGASPVVGVQYLGKGLRRREILGYQSKSDLAEKLEVRFSEDNGRTWSPRTPLQTGPD